MAVTIISNHPALHVEGDIRARLSVPAEPAEVGENGEALVDCYYISLSDGSLIQASYHDDPEFDVVIEGAGNVTISKDGKSLEVDWRMEWINLGPNRQATALAHKLPASLPLFDNLTDEAA